MTTPLGFQPNKGQVLLTTGADWVCTLTASGATWPDGTTVFANFYDTSGNTLLTTVNATVTAASGVAAFVMQSTTADTIPANATFRIFYKLPGSTTTEFAWFVGKVKRVNS